MTVPTRPLLGTLLGTLLVSCLLVGCGDEPSAGDDGAGTPDASELTETTTPEALAAAVLTHLDVDPISLTVTELDEEAPADAVAVSMRLPLSYDDRGMLLQVTTTAEDVPEAACGEDDNEDGCTDEDLGGGGRQLMSWQAEEPEEDPGIVTVLTERTDPPSSVVLYLAGPTIPEDLTDDTDLELFTPADLKDITLDPRVGPSTTPELVAAGEDIPEEWWVESEY